VSSHSNEQHLDKLTPGMKIKWDPSVAEWLKNQMVGMPNVDPAIGYHNYLFFSTTTSQIDGRILSLGILTLVFDLRGRTP